MAASGAFTLGDLAARIGATVEGDPARVIRGVAALEAAGPEDLALVADARYARRARGSAAGAFLVGEEVADPPRPALRCRAPRLALIELLQLFHPAAAPAPGVDPSAVVAPDARIDATAVVGALAVVESGAVIGPGVRVYPLVYVGHGCSIGEASVLHPHVVVREGVRIGRRVIVHAGAILGSDGFGYAFDGAGHRKVPQVGGLVVGDDVEIGANATLDRGTLGDTVVRRGTKIDNLVMVAHNVEIGEHCIVAAQTGIAGSSRIGRLAVLGGQVGIGDHVTIGEGAVLGSQSGVITDVAPGERLAGTYGRPLGEFKRIWVAEAALPDLLRRVRVLERRLAELERGGRGPGGADG
jgi:UDP-3-O-[3-hydroxymyristoyl] glucosamine N-acyltransferase